MHVVFWDWEGHLFFVFVHVLRDVDFLHHEKEKRMKKILVLLVVLFGSVVLAGCEGLMTDPEEDTFVFMLESLSGEVLLEEQIPWVQDDSRDNLAVIEAHVDLDYDVYDFGVFVKGIGGHYPREHGVTWNYWFALEVDGAVSEVGIKDVTIQKDTVITFRETTSLDETGVLVDEIVHGFLANHAQAYVTPTSVSHHVAAALGLLESAGHDVSSILEPQDDVTAFLAGLGSSTPSTFFRSVVISNAFQTGTTYDSAGITASNHYDAVALLSALDILGEEVPSGLLGTLMTSTPEYMDADYAGMLLEALAGHDTYESVPETVTAMTTYLADQMTSSGMSAWGTPNAASTASAISGLVSQGIDPRSEDWTYEGTDLIDALLSYAKDGVFLWKAGDENPDMMFSTPQAFAALVQYKVFRDTWGNPATPLF
jgi:hypothetical protein